MTQDAAATANAATASDTAATASDTAATASDTAAPALMEAWRQHRYGGPEAVALEQVPVPEPRAGEVLLRVRASSVNSGDVHVMRGDPLLLRAFFGLRRPRVAGRGMDVVGRVVAVGAGVDAFSVGDEVMGELPGGTLADFVAGPAPRLTLRPPTLDPVAAAAIPLAGGTAWQALELGAVGEGQRVLVIGAGGGVGTFTVQLAVARGAEVWALCGARAEPLIADLGAVRTFDYRAVEASTLPPSSFDAVIDIAGTAPIRTLRALLTPGGTLVLVSGVGSRLLGPIGRILRGAVLSLSRSGGRRIRPLAATAKGEVTREVARLAAAGRIAPAIERTWPLGEAGAALAHVDAGHAVGKVVVTVG